MGGFAASIGASMTRKLQPYERKGKASVLKEDDVRRIRDLASSGGQSTLEMARFYGVSVETIRRAIRGETWTHLHMSPMLSEAELQAASNASAQRMLKQIAAEKERLALGDKMVEEIKNESPFTEEAHRFKGDTSSASSSVQDKLREMGLIK